MKIILQNLKDELKTLYPELDLSDNELETMAKDLIQLFDIGIKRRKL